MTFGKYFKELRVSKKVTQQQIADVIGKTKMLVSGVESGKNGPFSDDDLFKVAHCLELTKIEYEELILLAAKETGKLPSHLVAYIVEYRKAYRILETMKFKALNEESLERIMNFMEEM